MSSFLNVTSGSGLVRSGMIASGCVFGSRTTFAIRVRVHLAKIGAWQLRQLADPVYSDPCARREVVPESDWGRTGVRRRGAAQAASEHQTTPAAATPMRAALTASRRAARRSRGRA